MNGKTIAWSLLALSVSSTAAFAQEKVDSTENLFSARPISDGDIMMKRTLWRRVDLKEKQNLSMFSKNNEITRYLLDAAKAGLIDAYTNDSCTVKITSADIHKRILIPNQVAGLSADEIAAGFGTPASAAGDGWGDKPKTEAAKQTSADDGWGAPKKEIKKEEAVVDDGWGPPKKKTTKKSKKEVAKVEAPVVEAPAVDSFQVQQTLASEEEYFPSQLSILEIKEDWSFDKKRSRLYNDIQTLSIVLPSDQTATGLELPVASFRYKDVERLFRSDPKKYIWYNTENTAQNKNLADAFDLRLFWGRITKFSNANDRAFLDIYGGEKEALQKSLNYEQELMELEHGLWEY
ncbi:type IX secretion system ring protein PorN/GldN [Dyadobacter psychrotolerans]|uniref:Gliding motility protein GldN n=1 Tax=Dyadobacter psychrotolerans TaxID=2541721 RepID=A0A4R5DQM3_9BACT|nr:gliding motility protein GldN [Dyadobacter psychrotolerans]TDE16682.1 gliding motility protein GldN [Dyadobacter psychrotolerans]